MKKKKCRTSRNLFGPFLEALAGPSLSIQNLTLRLSKEIAFLYYLYNLSRILFSSMIDVMGWGMVIAMDRLCNSRFPSIAKDQMWGDELEYYLKDKI